MANITVKYLKTDNGEEIKVYKASMVDIDNVYPVGSIYQSTVDVSPAYFIGGTWERIQGKFLLGASDGTVNQELIDLGYARSGGGYHYYINNAGGRTGITPNRANYASVGGETRHTLSTAEMPSHSHTYYFDMNSGIDWYIGLTGGSVDSNHSAIASGPQGRSYTMAIRPAGGSGAHNNMPPYQVVYMWKRIS